MDAGSFRDVSAFRVHPHVDQGIGSALVVDRRAPGANEAQPLVKADRLRILLVDIGRNDWMKLECVCDHGAPDTDAVKRRVDEQRVHMRARESHESDRPIRRIDREPQRALGQKLPHLGIDRAPVLRREKVMRRVDRVAPDRHHAIAVRRPGRVDREHGAGQRKSSVSHAPLSQPNHATASHVCESRARGTLIVSR
jgi:hypothetical protein